jgi:hypothetical protein
MILQDERNELDAALRDFNEMIRLDPTQAHAYPTTAAESSGVTRRTTIRPSPISTRRRAAIQRLHSFTTTAASRGWPRKSTRTRSPISA